VLDDSTEENRVVDEGDMVFTLLPVDEGNDDKREFISLKFKMEVSYSFAERLDSGYLPAVLSSWISASGL
jgi:hypothetical protein